MSAYVHQGGRGAARDDAPGARLRVVAPSISPKPGDLATSAGRMRHYREGLQRRELSTQTIRNYCYLVSKAEWWCEDEGYSLRNVPPLVLAQFVDALPKSHASRRMARSAFKHYWEIFKRKDPPLWVVKVPRKPRMVCRALTEEEARRLAELARSRGGREALAVLFAMYMGFRREEIATVRWDDVREDGWITLIGKGDLPARLPLHPVVREALDKIDRDRSPWVFPSRPTKRGRERGHVTPAVVWRWVQLLAAEAGLENVSTHRLRHTCLAQANDVTGDLRAVQDFARHADISTTTGYTRTTERRLLAVLAAIRYGEQGGEEPPPGSEPAALAEEADWLSSILGAAPPGDGWSSERASWFERFGMAAARVGELAGGDPTLLRTAAGDELGARPGRMLLITAAIRAERIAAGE